MATPTRTPEREGDRPLRVLLLVHYYFPNIQSCAKLLHDLGVVLTDQGHEVVIAAPDDTLTVPRTISRESGMTILRVRSGRFREVPLPVRAYNEWRLPANMWRGAQDFFADNRCELIVSYSPTIFFGPLVRKLKQLWGSRTYLVLRDIFPQWSVDAGVIREGSLVHRFFRHYETLLYDTADTIGVETVRHLDYFEQRGPTARYDVEVLRNWASTETRDVPTTSFRERLGLEDQVVFFYGGNLGVAQDASAIVRLAAAMRDEPRTAFLIVGSGSEATALRLDSELRGLENLHFLPPVDQKTYLGMVAEADVGLVTLNRDLSIHNFPSKTLDYMLRAKPVLAAVNTGNDLRQVLEEHEAGFVFWNGDDEELYEGALRLARSEELRLRLGRNSRSLLEALYSAKSAAAQILAASHRPRPA